jgi:hypothetical protein
MHEWHGQQMENFIKGDTMTVKHSNVFFLNAKGKLTLCELLVQIVPSISKGLRYAVFFKNIYSQTIFFAINPNNEVVYQS